MGSPWPKLSKNCKPKKSECSNLQQHNHCERGKYHQQGTYSLSLNSKGACMNQPKVMWVFFHAVSIWITMLKQSQSYHLGIICGTLQSSYLWWTEQHPQFSTLQMCRQIKHFPRKSGILTRTRNSEIVKSCYRIRTLLIASLQNKWWRDWFAALADGTTKRKVHIEHLTPKMSTVGI